VLFAANRNDYGAERVSMPIPFAESPATVVIVGVNTTHALAFTGAGSSTGPVAWTGFALLLVGGALLIVARRRQVSA
jgi:LPXTG-motif cell wall-anchored protein